MATDELLMILINKTDIKFFFRERTKEDISKTLQSFTDLVPEVKMHEFPNGQKQMALALTGTIPVNYKGTTYHIPIALYCRDSHPYNGPFCYVTPTATMRIKTSKRVDDKGRIYLPYLSEWSFPDHDTCGLLQVMTFTFQEECPVFSVTPSNGSASSSLNSSYTTSNTTSTPVYQNSPYPTAHSGRHRRPPPPPMPYPINAPYKPPYQPYNVKEPLNSNIVENKEKNIETNKMSIKEIEKLTSNTTPTPADQNSPYSTAQSGRHRRPPPPPMPYPINAPYKPPYQPNVKEPLTSNIIGNKEKNIETNKTLIEEIEKLSDALTLNIKMVFEKKFFQENCGKIKFPDDEKIYEVSGENFTFDRNRSFLGRGKSSVFSAKHEETRKDVALKEIYILHTRRLDKEDQDKIKSFIQELEIMKTVFECNKIVQIYGFYLEGINAVMCMELMSCSLKDLYNRIHERPDKFGTLSEILLGEVSVSILDALIYCKQKDIIHRDIKPGNILLNRKGEIKLCDFGESRLLENSLATTTVGTLVYFSPERFEQAQYDVRSDVWSLGIALAEIIHGRIPYKDIDKDDSDRCLYIKIQKIISAITKEELVPKCYEEKYSKDAVDFLKSCLEPFENRPKFDGLQKKEFYIRHKNADFKLYIKYLVEQMEALEKEVTLA